MEYVSKSVYMREYYGSLDGDVSVSTVTTVNANDREYTVVDWAHDGKCCVDIYKTVNGCIEVYVPIDEHSDDDSLHMAVYTDTYACLRMEDEIPEGMKEAFIETALG